MEAMMLSDKLKSLATLLDLAAHGTVQPDRAVMHVAHRVARDLVVQVAALEAAQIPRRQRLHDDHLASGKVVMLPIIARSEAVQS
jgi:hypothetical protein